LAYVTGLVNQELLLENEYLAAENRIWKARLQPGWRLSDGERATLAEIGKRLGRKGLEQVARLAKPRDPNDGFHCSTRKPYGCRRATPVALRQLRGLSRASYRRVRLLSALPKSIA